MENVAKAAKAHTQVGNHRQSIIWQINVSLTAFILICGIYIGALKIE